jgi:hypothetical protein
MERSEGDMLLKNPVTPPGIDPGTVRLVAQRLEIHITCLIKMYALKGNFDENNCTVDGSTCLKSRVL